MRKKLSTVVNLRQLLTIALIVVGLVMVVVYGLRTVRSYRQVRYIQEQGFDMGDANADAIRPWMTIHFVAAAYAVPEEYIYAKLGIDLERRRRNIDVGHLNQELRLARSANGPYPTVIDRLQEIILAYRADPVVTGLDDVREWMTLEYIANSTGVSAETIIAELGLDALARAESGQAEISIYQPLIDLATDMRYPRGPRGLSEDIKAVLSQHAEEGQ